MRLPTDPPPSARSPKPMREERRTCEAERLLALRLRGAIDQALEERGITDPHAIASALNMPQRDAIKLLNRHQWQEGDLALLQSLAVRLGVHVPDAKPSCL